VAPVLLERVECRIDRRMVFHVDLDERVVVSADYEAARDRRQHE